MAGDALTTLARAALADGDRAGVDEHCAAARSHYRTTGTPGRLRALDRIARDAAAPGRLVDS